MSVNAIKKKRLEVLVNNVLVPEYNMYNEELQMLSSRIQSYSEIITMISSIYNNGCPVDLTTRCQSVMVPTKSVNSLLDIGHGFFMQGCIYKCNEFYISILNLSANIFNKDPFLSKNANNLHLIVPFNFEEANTYLNQLIHLLRTRKTQSKRAMIKIKLRIGFINKALSSYN